MYIKRRWVTNPNYPKYPNHPRYTNGYGGERKERPGKQGDRVPTWGLVRMGELFNA